MSTPYILTINVRYHEGTKATQFFSKASSDANAQLKQDLQKLKFPTPAECNITFVSPGCMKAMWITTLTSPLYRRLKILVHRSKSPGMSNFWDSAPNRLDIEWITLQETPVDSGTTQNPGYTQFDFNSTTSPSSSHGSSVQGRKRGYSTDTGSAIATDSERKASSSRSRRASDGLVPSPPKRSRIDVNGRDRMLDLALQARRTSTPQTSPSNRSRPSSTSGKQRSNDQPGAPTPGSSSKPAQRSETEIQMKDRNGTPKFNGPIASSTSISTMQEMMLRKLMPDLNLSVSIKKALEQIRTDKNSDEVRIGGFFKISIDMQQKPKLMDKVEPKPSEFDAYNPLICIPRAWKSYSIDLTEMERNLENEKEERSRLEESLKGMQDSLDTARSRLSTVDMELKAEREKREELEKELMGERKRRIEAENILNDVERECRTPFVVPAMIEAFKTISTLTTWTMDIKNSKTST